MKFVKPLLSSFLLLGSLFAAPQLLAQTQPAETVTVEAEAPATQAEPMQPVVVGDKLNINTASAAEIQKALTGIGAKKAEAIVQYREKHGPFTAAEQLLEVQGIGKATLEKNRDRIMF